MAGSTESKLYLPTAIYSGHGVVKNHAQELKKLGTKAMIVTGRHSSRVNGSLRDVQTALEAVQIPYVVYDEIEENPSVETVTAAAELAKKEKIDFLIGIGGGSPMDAAKAISLLARNPQETQQLLYEKKELPYYPLAEVPTTSGTGSEVTPYAILTLHEKHTKQSISHKIYPALALVDFSYLKTSSYPNMVSTCVDALAHLIESYLNTNADAYNRIYAREGLPIWGSEKNTLLLQEAFTDETLENFMHCSTIAGMAITHTGTSIPHGLSYPVTYELGVSHGKAVGIFLPGFLRHYQKKQEVDEVLGMLGFLSVEEFAAYLDKILGPVEIPEQLWQKDVAMLLSNPAKLKNYPFEMTKEILEYYR